VLGNNRDSGVCQMGEGVYYSCLDFFASCEDFLCCVACQFIRVCVSGS
jgi:hypothetical protein